MQRRGRVGERAKRKGRACVCSRVGMTAVMVCIDARGETRGGGGGLQTTLYNSSNKNNNNNDDDDSNKKKQQQQQT